MLHIKSLEEGLDIFKALGSEVRIGIIKNLSENRGMNMNELAAKLNITNGALTGHIKKLEDCGLVTVSNESGGHGNEKKCSVCLDKILIEMDTQEDYKNIYQTDLKV
ncbi:MAG: helix-turn-helix domain-containing protein, partial [Lachnospiraceae bacterium]|nr:helix-turn-helix domain-containing protein [Lachnospiraceae bacterium]